LKFGEFLPIRIVPKRRAGIEQHTMFTLNTRYLPRGRNLNWLYLELRRFNGNEQRLKINPRPLPVAREFCLLKIISAANGRDGRRDMSDRKAPAFHSEQLGATSDCAQLLAFRSSQSIPGCDHNNILWTYWEPGLLELDPLLEPLPLDPLLPEPVPPLLELVPPRLLVFDPDPLDPLLPAPVPPALVPPMALVFAPCPLEVPMPAPVPPELLEPVPLEPLLLDPIPLEPPLELDPLDGSLLLLLLPVPLLWL
jgi:hypothetical protein